MFEHSIKVPRLYKTAAKIAQNVKENGASLKQLVYEKKHANIKGIYALVISTLQHEEDLNAILRQTQILKKENRLDPWLARILISELLWGKKKLSSDCKPVKTILSYQEQILQSVSSVTTTKAKSKKVTKPKYVRINTLKLSVNDAVDIFRDDGWSLVRCGDGSDYAAFLATSVSLGEDQFMVDTLIKDLLLFPPASQFYNYKLYKNGSFVLQDKASCMVPYLLNPPNGSTVLDMCAAPGMKCTQLAAMVKDGKVYAVERDERRYQTLKDIIETAGANNVTTINKDVLTLTDSDLPNVEYISVDPSCSGSGITDRIEFEDKSSHCNESRLQKLAGFQITILRHALNNFKATKRIIYSTCSIYEQENEQVVEQAITTTPEFKLVPLNEQLKDKWYNYGSEKYGKIGQSCLYSKPEIDRTNGFFIAVFERLKEGERNEFFVRRVHRTSECESVQGIGGSKADNAGSNDGGVNVKGKKRKTEVICGENNEEFSCKKKKRKSCNKDMSEIQETNEENSHKSKKTKKSDIHVNEDLQGDVNYNEENSRRKKKKKRDQNVSAETFTNNEENDSFKNSEKKKHKKIKLCNENDEANNELLETKNEIEDLTSKKKKKKKKNL